MGVESSGWRSEWKHQESKKGAFQKSNNLQVAFELFFFLSFRLKWPETSHKTQKSETRQQLTLSLFGVHSQNPTTTQLLDF